MFFIMQYLVMMSTTDVSSFESISFNYFLQAYIYTVYIYIFFLSYINLHRDATLMCVLVGSGFKNDSSFKDN